MRVITVLAAAAIPLLHAACADSGPTVPVTAGQADLEDHLAVVAPAVTAACGSTVTTDLTLESDLSCPGDAFTVAGSDLKINLNGHTVAGAGAGVGIRVSSAQGVSIYGGTVRGFLQGIFLGASTDIEIKNNEFTENGTAVLLQASSGNTIKDNVARANGLRAFMIRPNLAGVVSTNNDVVGNLIIDNPTGIFLINQPGNTIKGNTISGSSVAAIDLSPGGGSGNMIKGNLLTTSAAGIRFTAGWTGNTVVGNIIQTNDCGIQGPTAGNTIQGNTLSANTLDFCP
jgi:parallel beta-helix repeat protein